MVLKRTENILICIVIVYSVKILEFKGIKYFQKPKNWEVCIKLCLFVSVHLKKSVKTLKMSVSYQSSRIYLILYLKSKNASR